MPGPSLMYVEKYVKQPQDTLNQDTLGCPEYNGIPLYLNSSNDKSTQNDFFRLKCPVADYQAIYM